MTPFLFFLFALLCPFFSTFFHVDSVSPWSFQPWVSPLMGGFWGGFGGFFLSFQAFLKVHSPPFPLASHHFCFFRGRRGTPLGPPIGCEVPVPAPFFFFFSLPFRKTRNTMLVNFPLFRGKGAHFTCLFPPLPKGPPRERVFFFSFLSPPPPRDCVPVDSRPAEFCGFVWLPKRGLPLLAVFFFDSSPEERCFFFPFSPV